MSIPAGTRLGPYEILNALGSGGMGEVYRARDTRLGREVAVKVLPRDVSSDPERLRRFEKESRAASSLNHPGIVTIFDIGESNSHSYIAMELVEGETLREILGGGALPTKRLLQIAVQIAEGLSKAHAAGIVHRDLKPENVMVTPDGFAKILDFGLAKLTQNDHEGKATDAPTVSVGTEPGIVMGTVGYMSPEQARGRSLDFRSDQFSFGSLLYEMATGKRAFHGESTPEVLASIIREEPEPLAAISPKVPAPLRWTIERCLAKDPRERYASTEDLARELSILRDRLSETASSGRVEAAAPRPRLRALVLPAGAVLLLGAGLLAGRLVWRVPSPSVPGFQRLTFQRGFISSARFSPDGQTIVYSSAWDGKPFDVSMTTPKSRESRSLELSGDHLFAISSAGDMALALRWEQPPFGLSLGAGVLARASLTGGKPRELLESIELADWSPDGKELAVVRKGPDRLEFPIGRTLYEAEGPIRGLRVSPTGDLVALESPRSDGLYQVLVIDKSGKKKVLSSGWVRPQGFAWSASGREVWFTGTREGTAQALYGVTLSGRERPILRVPGRLTLQDIARDGRVLLTHEHVRREMVGLAPGELRERDLSWLDYSRPCELSRDGKTVLFAVAGASGGFFLRGMDGSPPVQLDAGGGPCGLSPDGRWVFTGVPGRYQLVPTGAGEAKPVAVPKGLDLDAGGWFQDGKRLLVEGSVDGEHGGQPRDYVLDLASGSARPVTPEGVSESVLSPDGKEVFNTTPDHKGWMIYPVEAGESRLVTGGFRASDLPVRWSLDGRSIFGARAGVPGELLRLDLATGRVTSLKKLTPADPAGVLNVEPYWITPDAKSYVYSFVRVLSDLYLVEGLK